MYHLGEHVAEEVYHEPYWQSRACILVYMTEELSDNISNLVYFQNLIRIKQEIRQEMYAQNR